MTDTFGHIALPDGVVIDQSAPMSMMAQPRTQAFQPDAGVLDVAKSAFHETWMSSVIDWYNRESFAPDPSFVPNTEVDDLIKKEPRLARHRTWLNSTQSKNELSYAIEQARKADVHAQIAEDNPAMFFALSLAVGIPDPLNLVGLGAVARSRSLAEAMATGARAGLLQGSMQGVLSYATDPRFSMSDVMASASFGSMIGAGAGTALHFSSARRGRTVLDDHLDNPLSRPSIHPDEIPGTSARARSETAPGPLTEGSSQSPDRIRPGFYSSEHFVPGGDVNRAEIKPGLYSADQFTPGFVDRAGVGGPETPAAGSGAFKPSADWQAVPPGTVLPPGMEIRIDLESGAILARKLPDDGASTTSRSSNTQADGEAAVGGARKGIEPGLYPAEEFIPDQRKGPEGSVGAMQNPNRPTHVPGEAETGTGIEKLKVGPIQRAIASRFSMMNDIATRLFSSPVSKLNQLGVGNAISAEVGSWRWQSNLANLSSAIDNLFLEYRGASQGMLSMAKLLVTDSVKGAPAGLMSRNEFKKRVWQSYVFDELHQEPQVNAASAKILEFYKAFSDERLALGMTKVEVPYFEFHLRNGIMRERPFPRVWNEHVLTTPEGRAEFKKAWNDYKALLHPSHEHFKTSWEWALDTLTLERPFVSADGEITGVSSSMYSRNLKVPTKLFEKFVVTDPEQIAKMYAKSMGVDIEIARRFRVLGPDGSDLGPDSLLRNAVGELYAEAGSLVNDILVKGNQVWPRGGIDLMHQFLRQLDAIGEQSRNAAQLLAKNGTADPASLARIRANAVLAEQMLEQQFSALFLRISPEARDIFNDVRTAHRDVSDLRALLRGTYGQAADPFSVTSRSIRVAKQLSSLILLSGAVAALPDIGNLALREGLRETMAPLLSWFRSSDPERAAIMKNAAFIKEAGQALDMVLNSRALAMTDMSDIHGRYSTFERILDNAQAAGFVLNLLSPWTAAMKQYSGVVVQSNLFRRLNEWSAGTLSDPERAQLLARGITEQLRDDILDQMRTHGRQHGDIFLPNAHDWDVQATREAYAGILADLVNRIVVSPSPAEMPLLFSKEHGSLIFQFKSFGLGTVNRVLVPALQEADGRLVTGVAMLVAMGSIVDELKWAASGNTRERSDEEKLYRAIERSGVLGWFVDAGKAIDTVTDGRFGWGAMTGAPHREQNFVQKWTDLMGPSASLVTSATELGHHLLTEGPDANAAKRLASLTPLLGRVTHFSWATNAMTNHENWKRQTYGNDASSLPQELPWMLPQGPANANATKP